MPQNGRPAAPVLSVAEVRMESSTGASEVTEDHTPYVRVEDLIVTYTSAAGHSVRALDSVSFEVPRNTFMAVEGPSGSGKSTLLYVLAGLLRATGGSVQVGGKDLVRATTAQLAAFRCAHIGFVFQSFHLLPHLRAWENVALPMLALGVSAPDRQKRSSQILSKMGLGAHINHRPGELSAGEQQRVAIARAVANSPALILADEPTGNLDSANGAAVAQQLSDLVGQSGATVICATHDADLAARAQIVMRLVHGRFKPTDRLP